MTDAIVITCYRSPRTCRSRVRLLRLLNPESIIFVVFTGDPGVASSFIRVFAEAHYSYEVPTRNTKDNWYGLDRALLRWWVDQGRSLGLNRVLFLDWDVLLVDPASRLLNQLSQGQVLFSLVFPVLSQDVDHWARDFAKSNSNVESFLLSGNHLSRAFLFAWASFASDLNRVVDIHATLNGFCEVRLPFALLSSGVRLGSFSGVCNDFCNVMGEGISLSRLRAFKSSWPGVLIAHPVYLPVATPAMSLDFTAYLFEVPFVKTWGRKLRKVLRSCLVGIGLLSRLNP